MRWVWGSATSAGRRDVVAGMRARSAEDGFCLSSVGPSASLYLPGVVFVELFADLLT
jgi:hypothetical protein